LYFIKVAVGCEKSIEVMFKIGMVLEKEFLGEITLFLLY